jgi:hypothetical protein
VLVNRDPTQYTGTDNHDLRALGSQLDALLHRSAWPAEAGIRAPAVGSCVVCPPGARANPSGTIDEAV